MNGQVKFCQGKYVIWNTCPVEDLEKIPIWIPAVANPASTVCKKVDLRGRLSDRGKKKKKTDPIPMFEEELPHTDVQLLVEGNKVPQVTDPVSEIVDPLHEGLTREDNSTGFKVPMRD